MDTTPLDPPPQQPAGDTPPAYTPPAYTPPAYTPPTYTAPMYTGAPGYGPPPEYGAQPPPGAPRKVTVTRVAASRTRELTGAAVRRVQAASRADGAGESGLSHLLWVNALHMAGDAMIAVSLAGTLFFAATTNAQRGNVALYLVVTMAPFAVVAPVIGPALDRLQRGRRWAMAGALVGRAILALVMATHYHDVWLYPAALGVLVMSKAFNVLRAAVVPRVLPDGLPLTSANARLSVFGLITAAVFGAVGGGIVKAFGFHWELWATAIVFAVAGVLAIRLPHHVDVPTGEMPADVLTTAPVDTTRRGRRAVSPRVVTALRANAALKGLGGFLTIFSAFLVEAHLTGWEAGLALGGIAAAAGVGSVLGTAAGSRLRNASPDTVILVSASTAAAITVVAAIFFSIPMAAAVAGVSAVTNALGKVALDAIIQHEVPEAMRASAFARSETWLQLAWVVGGVMGIVLPPTGWLGFTVTAALLVLAVALTLWGRHRIRRQALQPAWQPAPEPTGPAYYPDGPTTPFGQQWP
jgi:MFS family permease